MTDSDIQKLKDFCEHFKQFRDNTVNGNGNNLHDIKVTFDYVKKTLDTYNLTGTTFGSELSSKCAAASDVLSQLWSCLSNLEKAVELFCLEQEKANKQSQY